MVIIHHNKDMDGFASGAICKLRYPEAKLIGWDYSESIPDFEQFRGEEVIMIDVTFPIREIILLASICELTIIDHHISFKKQIDELDIEYVKNEPFYYVYEANKAACEIGWEYLFPELEIPRAITLIGRYDTWRKDEGDWENETMPFKYFMYGNCNSVETFPSNWIFGIDKDEISYHYTINNAIEIGKSIAKYQENMDEGIVRKNVFPIEAYGLKAIAINYFPFSSEVLKSIWDDSKYDIQIGFFYTNGKWGVSLRSIGDKVDCSLIAKARGGGGHKNAAGFEVTNFNKIFE